MPPAVFGKRFISKDVKAWHDHLGEMVTNRAMTAVEFADEKIDYDILKLASPIMQVDGVDVNGMEQQFALVRTATADSPTPEFFGWVSGQYNLMTPREFAEIHTANVRAPIETMGALRGGRATFITTRLPDINLDGDVIENYMLAVDFHDGGGSAYVKVTEIRVVCQNTLAAALARTGESYPIPHDGYLKSDLAGYMVGIEERSVARVQILQEAYEVLAGYTATADEADEIFQAAYPKKEGRVGFEYDENGLAIGYDEFIPEAIGERYIDPRSSFNYNQNAATQRREGAMWLWGEYKGIGMQMDTCKDTLFGAVNAVAEMESHLRIGKKAALGLVHGDRVNTIERATERAFEIAGLGS